MTKKAQKAARVDAVVLLQQAQVFTQLGTEEYKTLQHAIKHISKESL